MKGSIGQRPRWLDSISPFGSGKGEGQDRAGQTWGLSPYYGIHTVREAHEWFLQMMREHEEFEVETDRTGEWPVPFYPETVRRVVVE